jgi:hypothetical protein
MQIARIGEMNGWIASLPKVTKTPDNKTIEKQLWSGSSNAVLVPWPGK